MCKNYIIVCIENNKYFIPKCICVKWFAHVVTSDDGAKENKNKYNYLCWSTKATIGMKTPFSILHKMRMGILERYKIITFAARSSTSNNCCLESVYKISTLLDIQHISRGEIIFPILHD